MNARAAGAAGAKRDPRLAMMACCSTRWMSSGSISSHGELRLIGDGQAVMPCDLHELGSVEQLIAVAREEAARGAHGPRAPPRAPRHHAHRPRRRLRARPGFPRRPPRHRRLLPARRPALGGARGPPPRAVRCRPGPERQPQAPAAQAWRGPLRQLRALRPPGALLNEAVGGTREREEDAS
jgi:hypothetical protein